MSNSTLYNPIKEVDIFLGTTLAVAGIFGLPANIASFYCFYHIREPHRKNSNYFKILYMIITVVDSMICFSQLPVVESFITQRRGTMFSNPTLCKGWVTLWRALIITSIWCVAQLSISRLVLLISPRKTMSGSLLTLPGVVFSGFLVAVIGTQVDHRITMYYFPTVTATCASFGYTEGFNYTEAFIFPIPIPLAVVKADITSNILASLCMGLPFIPILISFMISLIYLYRIKMNAKRAKICSKKQSHAKNTIIFVTLLYLICNIPSVTFLAIRVIRMSKLIVNIEDADTVLILREITQLVNPTYFEKYYIRSLVQVVSVVINSTLNPLVYVWRMKAFSNFLLKKSTCHSSELVHLSMR